MMMLVSTTLRSLSTSSENWRNGQRVDDGPLAFEWRLQAPAGRGSVKTQNQFHGFQFWQFLINQYAQNRTTIGLFALFCAPKLSVTSFYTASANCGP